MYEECTYININIKYKSEHVGKSPYLINKAVYPDDCYCPQKSIMNLLKSWQCVSVPPQIVKDFEPFSNIDWSLMRSKVSAYLFSFQLCLLIILSYR